MNPTIREVSAISLLSARNWNAQPREAMISITGTGERRVPLKKGWAYTIRLCFDDIEVPRLGRKLFSEEDADKVIDFLDKVEGKVDHVVVHCTHGLSRSPALAKNLATFDDLDFRVYTGQQWQDLHKSHSKDVVVHWPDGHSTKGIEKHIEDLKVMFSFAPDNRIKEHPVRFGTADGQWTAVTGWLEGTFTKSMVLPDGKTIPPTGKAYRIPMATIGHWGKDGVMFEEYLFWDNGEFMRQIGLAP